MKQLLKQIIPGKWLVKYRRYKALKSLDAWERAGRPIPYPHIVKQLAIEAYQQKTGYRILVETGTFMGDMVDAQRYNFNKIYSIELSEELYNRAVDRFKNDNHIELLQGDSGERLEEVVRGLTEPAIFWLDGHYSGGITAQGSKVCPVNEELTAILRSPIDHCILIDDARCFGRDADYPTLEEIRHQIDSNRKGYSVTVQDDIIRIIRVN